MNQLREIKRDRTDPIAYERVFKSNWCGQKCTRKYLENYNNITPDIILFQLHSYKIEQAVDIPLERNKESLRRKLQNPLILHGKTRFLIGGKKPKQFTTKSVSL